MPSKRIGKGTVVSVDALDNAEFTPIGMVVETTPPPRSRVGVDGQTLGEDLATEEPGVEEVSEFTFRQFWHPGDTNHEIIDTLFGSQGKVDWRCILPYTKAVTLTFKGWVKAMTPETVTVNDIISREVTVSRTSAITTTTAS